MVLWVVLGVLAAAVVLLLWLVVRRENPNPVLRPDPRTVTKARRDRMDSDYFSF